MSVWGNVSSPSAKLSPGKSQCTNLGKPKLVTPQTLVRWVVALMVMFSFGHINFIPDGPFSTYNDKYEVFIFQVLLRSNIFVRE